MGVPIKVAVVEDDADLLQLISQYLERNGLSVCGFSDGRGLFPYILEHRDVDVVLLDLMLPYMDGMEILKMLKSNEQTKDVSVIIATVKDDESDVVAGLELGADDYIKKPFSLRELVARIRAVVRRKKKDTAEWLEVDTDGCRVFVDSKEVDLTFAEYSILKTLFENRGKVLSRSKLLDAVWGDDKAVTERSIDVHIVSLRKKLGRYGNRIKTVRGLGYRFEA